jgi:TRAP-type C4-dicarboxylate transport system permease small subunit
MSAPGRPKRESFERQREGSPLSAPGRPKGESPGAQREGSPLGAGSAGAGQGAPSAVDAVGEVMDADGHFHVTDAPIDLTQYRFEDWVALVFFWLLAGVIFHQFFTRYVLNDSAAWTEEIARYLLICTVFVGAAIGVRKNNHVQVDFFYRVLPRPLMRLASTLVDLVRVAFLGYAAWLTWLLTQRIGDQRMSIVDWPIGIVYGVVLFGFVLMTLRAVQVAIVNWRRGASVLEKPELAEHG